jgi:hypothetical protein
MGSKARTGGELMKDMTELTQALAAYLRAPVAQPLTEDSAPYICANAARKAFPNSNATLRDVLPFMDQWTLEEAAVISEPQKMTDKASVNTIVELGCVRAELLSLAYRLAGGTVSPEQAASDVFALLQAVHSVWATEIAARELDLMSIRSVDAVNTLAQQELNTRNREAA